MCRNLLQNKHSTISRLFRLLIREENFDDPVRQKLVVETLLLETYPHDQTTREKIACPAVCRALGGWLFRWHTYLSFVIYMND